MSTSVEQVVATTSQPAPSQNDKHIQSKTKYTLKTGKIHCSNNTKQYPHSKQYDLRTQNSEHDVRICSKQMP